MTQKAVRKSLRTVIMIFLFLLVSFLMSGEISKYALEGLRLAWGVIIPTVFPFMIFSEAVAAKTEISKEGRLPRIFERLFRISGSGLICLISGIIGGFPVGAKSAIDLQNDGIISKDECERLASFANIPSIAYTVCAVGMGFWGSFYAGAFLYTITLTSALISGVIIRRKRDFSKNTELIRRQSFNFVSSVKQSALSSLNISFFISFFSVVCGLIKKHLISPRVAIMILPFFEVGNAVSYISDLCIFTERLRFSLIAFSLSFSGLCVIMQSLSFASKNAPRIKKIIAYKLLSAAIAFLISYLSFPFISNMI